jgi:hypothetical protein
MVPRMCAGELPLVDLPPLAPANDPDVEGEEIVAALTESLRRLQASRGRRTALRPGLVRAAAMA